MTTRIVYRGAVLWANERPDRRVAFNDPAKDCFDAPVRAPMAGSVYSDKDSGLNYRVVSPGRLTADQGWAPAEYWIERYFKTRWEVFRKLVLEGLFDAAVEQQVMMKKYRPTDVRKIADRIKVIDITKKRKLR